MNRPSFELTVGKEEFRRDEENGLMSIEVVRTMDIPIESMSVAIAAGGDLKFGKEDDATLKLGYDDRLEKSFSGLLDRIEYGASVVELTSVGKSVKLLDLRINRVFMSQTAGEIVKSIADEAGVQVEKVDDGIAFPVYVVDDRSNCYEHAIRLAQRCGFDVYMNDEGKLVFGLHKGEASHKLEFGKSLLSARMLKELPAYGSAKVYGESPSSSKGGDTYHWLTKDDVLGSAGSGKALAKTDYSLKSKENAEEVSKALLNKTEYRDHIELEIVGDATVKLGDEVEVDGFGDAAFNGKFEVREVRHSLDKQAGFRSRVKCRRKAE